MMHNSKAYELKAENIFTPEQIEHILTAANRTGELTGKPWTYVSFVGIDPSINSTGLTSIGLSVVNSNEIILDVKHAIIPPVKFETRPYVTCMDYEKTLHANRTNTELENARLHNFQAIAEISKMFVGQQVALMAVGIEGLSYNARSGKRNSSSNVYDLAGLNTLIRDRVTLYLEQLKYNGHGVREFVASYPPKTVKAGFIHGNADKHLMYKTFERDYGFVEDDQVSWPIIKRGTNESYLFDVADSYAIAKREMFGWLDANVFPPPPPKVRKPRKKKTDNE
ncbi:holliday junction resolvase [Chryseobacterium phage MA9V-2]|nr:holliday junction resolvase [Chryseobacterium phage MA9V-2]